MNARMTILAMVVPPAVIHLVHMCVNAMKVSLVMVMIVEVKQFFRKCSR